MTDRHIERARQIADALDSQNVEQTLHEQFAAEFKAWEAEDPTRTQYAFDRAIGRSEGYTSRIVRFVTGRTSTAWGNAEQPVRDQRAARKVLADRPQEVAKEIAAALEDPDVAHAVVEAASTKGRESLDTAASVVDYHERQQQKPHVPPADAASHRLGGVGPGALANRIHAETMEPRIDALHAAAMKGKGVAERHGFRLALTDVGEFDELRESLVEVGKIVADWLDCIDAVEASKMANENEGAQR